jgi:transposase
MTKTQVEVITSVQRRRRWSRAEKERIVAAALEPGVVASEVAREAGIHTSQLFRWRQELCKRAPAPVSRTRHGRWRYDVSASRSPRLRDGSLGRCLGDS